MRPLEQNIAPRYEADLEIKASIFGGNELQSFLSVDASLSGIAIRAIDQEAPFRVGTLIEIKIPLTGETSTKTLDLTGRVVRVEEDLNQPELGKVLCGIHLVELADRERRIWSQVIDSFKEELSKRNEEHGSDYSYLLHAS